MIEAIENAHQLGSMVRHFTFNTEAKLSRYVLHQHTLSSAHSIAARTETFASISRGPAVC